MDVSDAPWWNELGERGDEIHGVPQTCILLKVRVKGGVIEGSRVPSGGAQVTGKPSMSAAADRRASPETNASEEGSPCAAARAAASCRASAARMG